MQQLVSLVAVGLAEELFVELSNGCILVGTTHRAVAVVIVQSLCAQSFKVNGVSD